MNLELVFHAASLGNVLANCGLRKRHREDDFSLQQASKQPIIPNGMTRRIQAEDFAHWVASGKKCQRPACPESAFLLCLFDNVSPRDSHFWLKLRAQDMTHGFQIVRPRIPVHRADINSLCLCPEQQREVTWVDHDLGILGSGRVSSVVGRDMLSGHFVICVVQV